MKVVLNLVSMDKGSTEDMIVLASAHARHQEVAHVILTRLVVWVLLLYTLRSKNRTRMSSYVYTWFRSGKF